MIAAQFVAFTIITFLAMLEERICLSGTSKKAGGMMTQVKIKADGSHGEEYLLLNTFLFPLHHHVSYELIRTGGSTCPL